MMLHTRAAIFVCVVGLGAAACGTPPAPAANPAVPTVQSPPAPGPDAIAVLADVYGERLRLGLGSPFRLIELALRDARLGDQRVLTARRLIEQIEDQEGALITPLALVAAGMPEANASAHLDLIRTTIFSASDTRAGELAINLAYEAAARQDIVHPYVAERVARIAALLRDQRLAREDVVRLRAAARASARAPEHLILAWRAERRFAVEQPSLAPLEAGVQQEAARLAALLPGGIRVAAAPVTGTPRRTIELPPAQLGAEALSFTRATADQRATQDAVLLMLRANRPDAAQPHARLHAAHWQTFFEHAVDEESFAAELAAARLERSDDIAAAGLRLDVATALRAFAQQDITQSPAVSAQDITNRFGVRVRFADSVGAAQRVHALNTLTRALDDLRSVVRGIDLKGLTFEIGAIAPGSPHIAYHDPKRRVIHLDPAAMAGTLAHEIAHDLDWQLARNKYDTRSHYATDYATKHRRAFAYVVTDLVASGAAMPNQIEPEATRPAEAFARRFEWYVATALAAYGRSNGYLSSVQSDWIAGYGGAVRPAPDAAAARSFAAIVAEATRMDRAERAAVERTIVDEAPATRSCRARLTPFDPPVLLLEACE